MTNETLSCPECDRHLPPVRQETPWCECGWSSIINPQIASWLTPKLQQQIQAGRERAQARVDGDRRVVRLLQRSWGRWLWRLYTLLLLLLCAPAFFLEVVLWTVLAAALLYTIIQGLWPLPFVVVGAMGAVLLFKRWTKPSGLQVEGIRLTCRDAPELFQRIDEVAAAVGVPSVHQINLRLDARFAVERFWTWRPRPRFERHLNLGLLTFCALTVSQFQALLACQLAAFRSVYASWGLILFPTLHKLGQVDAALAAKPIPRRTIDRQVSEHMQQGTGLAPQRYSRIARGWFEVALVPILAYGRLLAAVSRPAIRRMIYTADQVVARLYGSRTLLQALVGMGAVEIEFNQYLPSMANQFSSGLDRHDFYYQFLRHWEPMRPGRRELAYAKAVTLFQAAPGQGLAYQDRSLALERAVEPPDGQNDERSASVLLPQAADLGRELTAQLVRYWVKWDAYVVE